MCCLDTFLITTEKIVEMRYGIPNFLCCIVYRKKTCIQTEASKIYVSILGVEQVSDSMKREYKEKMTNLPMPDSQPCCVSAITANLRCISVDNMFLNVKPWATTITRE